MSGLVSALQPGCKRAAGWISNLTGKLRWIVAGILGLGSATALPPTYIVPLLIIAFGGLFWLVESSRRSRDALVSGWFFGLGHCIGGFYWIGNAFLVEAERFAWLMPLAVGGLCMGMALYPALACYAAHRCNQGRPRSHLWIAFIGFWVIAEWIRGHALTGFPWNPIGHVLAWSDALIQLAAVTGIWGISLLVMACATAPALLITATKGKKTYRWPFMVAYSALAISAVGGAIRLTASDQEAGAQSPERPVQIRLVQANIPQAEKWRPEWRQRNTALHLELSQAAWSGGGLNNRIDAIIWPETALPYLIDKTATVIPFFDRMKLPASWLIFGGVRVHTTDAVRQIWNSLLVIGERGRIAALYDKVRLVPFGEYIPLKDWLPIDTLTTGGGFSVGPGLETLSLPGLPAFSPLICYEVIFPGAVVDERPQWLLNLTNDSWFGRSSGPYQHLTSARLRAVEEGLPLARAANTGISAMIDPYGRITAQLPLGQRGILDARLPPSLSKTPYARWGDWVILGIIGVLILSYFIPRDGRAME